MSDTIRFAISILFLLAMIQAHMLAQEEGGEQNLLFTSLVEWAYGQDQELVNGLQYYNRHPRSLGHPYLHEGLVHQGSVNIRGKLYNGLWLRYDIHQQQVEVEYRTIGGADNQVILVNDRIRYFTIGSSYFERLELEKGQPRFYQVLGQDPMVWYIHWERNLVPKSGDVRFIEEYTSPKRTYLLKLNGVLHPFSNRKSFVQLFPKSVHKDLKKLMKSSQLRIRSASPEQLELFIMATSNLLKGGTP